MTKAAIYARVSTKDGRQDNWELAKLAGVSPDTLRHYERLGILPKAPRTASGYRMYSPDSLERVNWCSGVCNWGLR